MRKSASGSPVTNLFFRHFFVVFSLFFLGLSLFIGTPFATAYPSDLIDLLRGTKIHAQDPQRTFLGSIDSEYKSDSVFNEYGTYGSEYSSKSIWNEYGTFGSEYSSYSPFNSYSSKPPMIIKNGKIIGYLTVNSYINSSLSPYALVEMKGYF